MLQGMQARRPLCLLPRERHNALAVDFSSPAHALQWPFAARCSLLSPLSHTAVRESGAGRRKQGAQQSALLRIERQTASAAQQRAEAGCDGPSDNPACRATSVQLRGDSSCSLRRAPRHCSRGRSDSQPAPRCARAAQASAASSAAESAAAPRRMSKWRIQLRARGGRCSLNGPQQLSSAHV